MISLKTYITNFINENFQVDINNEIELHFYSEFIVNESFKYSYFNIFEKHVSYIQQKKLIISLAKEIYNNIRNQEPNDTFEIEKENLEEYSNIFFKKLVIYLYGQTGYQSSKSKYIESEKIFDQVVININPAEYSEYKDIVRTLVHELLHAYNDFESYLKNSKIKLQDLVNKKSSYYKTLLNGKTITSNICKRICNNIRQWEQNAYISELSIELENNKFDLSKYKDVNKAYKAAYEIFRNSDTWQQYSILWTYLNKLNKKGKNSQEQIDFQNTYNDINNSSLTFNQIYKKLDGLFYKILKKIERLVPKLFYDYYEEQMNDIIDESIISGRQNKSLIEFTKYITEYDCMESIKPENGKEWKVYVNGVIDNTFTQNTKKWKKYPKIGQGWYAGGTIFKIVKIKDNKIYTKTEQ